MTARTIPIVALALMLGLTMPALASETRVPEPGLLYEVVGVAADDALNVRAQPDASAEIVGTLPHDASDVKVAGTQMAAMGPVWWQVVRPEGLGWVNARYLAPVDAEAAPGDDAYPLRCTGTEPFWTLTMDGAEARFETPETALSWHSGEVTRAMGLFGRYAVRLESEEDVGHLSAWRNRNFCSDGMSDIGFPFEAILVSPDGTVYGGCCLRAGQ